MGSRILRLCVRLESVRIVDHAKDWKLNRGTRTALLPLCFFLVPGR